MDRGVEAIVVELLPASQTSTRGRTRHQPRPLDERRRPILAAPSTPGAPQARGERNGHARPKGWTTSEQVHPQPWQVT